MRAILQLDVNCNSCPRGFRQCFEDAYSMFFDFLQKIDNNTKKWNGKLFPEATALLHDFAAQNCISALTCAIVWWDVCLGLHFEVRKVRKFEICKSLLQGSEKTNLRRFPNIFRTFETSNL